MLGFVLCLLAFSPQFPTASPFDGTWKIDVQKSAFTGNTMYIEDLGDGLIRTSGYVYKLDGKDYYYGPGRKLSCKEADKRTTECLITQNGKTTTRRREISEDGKTMRWSTEGTRPDGQPFKNSGVMERVGTGTGMFGGWKSVDFKPSYAMTTQLQVTDTTFKQYDDQSQRTIEARFDGKEYTPEGPVVAPGSTVRVRRVNERTIEVITVGDGKVSSTDTLTVSPDSQTLTIVQSTPNSEATRKYVYTRQ